MPNFYKPDSAANSDNPFARDDDDKLVRRSYCLDLSDRSSILTMTQGIGSNLTNEQKRAHLTDIGRAGLIDQVCIQEVLPPEQ